MKSHILLVTRLLFAFPVEYMYDTHATSYYQNHRANVRALTCFSSENHFFLRLFAQNVDTEIPYVEEAPPIIRISQSSFGGNMNIRKVCRQL